MLANALDLLFTVLMMVCFIQPNAARFLTGFVFASVCIIHDATCSNLDGLTYYGSAAFADLLIAIIISRIAYIDRTVVSIIVVCIVSAMTNAAGWLMWFLYMSPTVYNLLFIAIYVSAIIILVKRSSGDCVVGGFKRDQWRIVLRRYHLSNVYNL